MALVKFCSTDDMIEHLDVAPIDICTDFKQIQKRGGSERFKYVKVAKNQIPIHIVALGSDLGTGSNRNQDLFKEADCIKCHHTFVKHGRAVHWSHVNKPTDPKYGDVYASDYNVPMRRIELLLGLDKDAPKNEKLLQNVSQGKQACFSMGCKVAHDICSLCNHKAPTPQTRCSHIPSQLGELTKEGQIVCMINPNPDFFDISAVHRNADRIAYSLNNPLIKHASFEKSAQDRYYDNIELANSIYVPPLILSKQASTKRTLLNKLSKMEKRVEAQGSKPEPYIKEVSEKLNKAPQISDATIKELREFDHNQLLKALADKGIIFTVEEFFKYLFQDKLQDNDKGLLSNIKTKLPTMFSDFDNDEELNSDDFEPSEKHPPLNLLNLVNNLFEGHSLFSKPTHRRIISITIIKPKTKEVQKQASVHPDLKEFVEAFVTKYANYKLSALAYLEEKNKLDDELIINSVIQNQR